MSVPHALEAAHNALVSKYKENETTVRSLRKTMREDIIPNVLDEMNEEDTQYDMQDLEDWANDTGVNIRMHKRTMIITPHIPQDLSFVPSRFVYFNPPIAEAQTRLCSVTDIQPPSLSKLFAIL